MAHPLAEDFPHSPLDLIPIGGPPAMRESSANQVYDMTLPCPVMAEGVEKQFRALRDATLIRAAALQGKIDSIGSRFGFNSCAEALLAARLRPPPLW